MKRLILIPLMMMMALSAIAQDVQIAGLINKNDVLRWGNDDLKDKNLTSIKGVELMKTNELVMNSMNCLDIVCYLLATTGTGADYIILSLDGGKDFEIFDADSKTVLKTSDAASLRDDLKILVEGAPEPEPEEEAEAVADSAFAVLADTAKVDSIVTAPVVPKAPRQKPEFMTDLSKSMDDLFSKLPPTDRTKTQLIRLRHFRSTRALTANPANISRSFEKFTTWNFADFEYNFFNSTFTPAWYTEWLTQGGVWSAQDKRDFLATFQDADVSLMNQLSFPTLFGFRIGPVSMNISGMHWSRITLPGSLLALPWTDIRLNESIEAPGIEVETVPMVVSTNISYGQMIPTPYGNIGAGVGVNILTAAGYVRVMADEFTIRTTEDSLFVNASGEGWYTLAGATGSLDDPNLDGLEPTELIGSQTVGLNLGARYDLYPFLNQEIEVMASVSNIGAKFKWEGVTHEAWTYSLRSEGVVNLQDYDKEDAEGFVEESTTEVLADDEVFELSVPAVFSFTTIYQPINQLMLILNFEKALSSEDILQIDTSPRARMQLSYYPIPQIDLSFKRSSLFDIPIYTLGAGLHFGIWNGRLDVNFHDGFNSSAKGAGLALSSSWHF